MEAIKEMSKYVGSAIRLRTPDGLYEGTLLKADFDGHSFSLCKVYMLGKKEDSYFERLNFYPRDVVGYKIVQKKSFSGEQEMGSNTEGCDGGISENCRSNRKEAKNKMLVPQLILEKIPHDFVRIDKVDSTFHTVVKNISKCDQVGVNFEGENISRIGTLCWIAISTQSITFLFDVLALKMKGFRSGLKEIFENPNIIKIIHDCRLPSDALFHIYQTKIVNIFDTQVADSFICAQNCSEGVLRRDVRTLSSCLKKYLDVLLDGGSRRCRRPLEEPDWTHRPHTKDMICILISRAAYLQQLKEVVEAQVTSVYHRVVDLCIHDRRDMSNLEQELNPHEPTRLPRSVMARSLTWHKVTRYATKSDFRNTKHLSHNTLIENFLDKIEQLGIFKDEESNQTSLYPYSGDSSDSCTGIEASLKEEKSLSNSDIPRPSISDSVRPIRNLHPGGLLSDLSQQAPKTCGKIEWSKIVADIPPPSSSFRNFLPA